jgi:glycopeptide antibiotics resistance protein
VLRRHPVICPLTVAYLLALAIVTLTPSTSGERVFSLLGRLVAGLQSYERAEWISYSGAEFVANILVFVPLGVLLVLLFGRRHWFAVVVAGLLASCWIELAQSIWLGDRAGDPRDIASNTIGTVVGVVCALLVTRSAANRHRRIADARTASHAGA